MKTYYIVSDVHSFFREFSESIASKGFSINNPRHILLLLGDAFDRGSETKELADFLLALYDANRLIYIRGNHEDLLERLVGQLKRGEDPIDIATSIHSINGTWQTALSIANMTESEAIHFPHELLLRVENSRVFKELLPSCTDYFESGKYVFTHGYVPCVEIGAKPYMTYAYDPNWRTASSEHWRSARWTNAVDVLKQGVHVPDKTVVVGHIHTSLFRKTFEGSEEWGASADFSPYVSQDGSLIAIDGCTAYTGKTNCIVLDEDDNKLYM